MRSIDDMPSRKHAEPVETPQYDPRQLAIKRNLAKGLDRSDAIKEAVYQWLVSMNGGMNKKTFSLQMVKLSNDDEIALKQLADSKGSRTLKQAPRKIPPKLDTDIYTALADYHSVAIEMYAGKKIIDKFINETPKGGLYVLDVNELILEYVDYQHRGRAGEIIEAATRASILVVTGLQKSISMAYHIRDTLYQIASVRAKDPNKYTLSTWNYTHMWFIPDYGNLFTIFSA